MEEEPYCYHQKADTQDDRYDATTTNIVHVPFPFLARRFCPCGPLGIDGPALLNDHLLDLGCVRVKGPRQTFVTIRQGFISEADAVLAHRV
jgi:hypothetical protein